MTQTSETTEHEQEIETEIAPDELTLLKQRATAMGLSYSPNIRTDSLRKRIEDALSGGSRDDEPEVPELSALEQKAALRKAINKREMKLVRLRIANLNPNKKDLSGEIFTVANKYLGIVKKFIPYGEATENGYHVEHVLYKQLKARKFLQIRTRQDRNTGQIVVSQKWVPEFSLDVLDPLTKEEIAELKSSQAATRGTE